MATPALDSDTILKATEDWSVTEQMTLAQAIMQRAAAQIPGEPPARTRGNVRRGMRSTGSPPMDRSHRPTSRWRDGSMSAGWKSMAASSGALRVLVVTNVALDLMLKREPWATQAKPLWDARDVGAIQAFVVASVATDIYYICRKQIGAAQAAAAVGECLHRFIIMPLDRAHLEMALALGGPDFEDKSKSYVPNPPASTDIVTRNASGSAILPC